MDNKTFKGFKERYLIRFKKTYKGAESSFQKEELKKNIFENNRLTETQKKLFWKEVTK